MQADLPIRTNQALRKKLFRDVELFEHIQGWRMKRRSPQILIDLPFCLENPHGDAGTGKQQRRTQSDRSASHDNDFAINFHDLNRLLAIDLVL